MTKSIVYLIVLTLVMGLMVMTSETLAAWTSPYRGRHWQDEANKRDISEAEDGQESGEFYSWFFPI